MPGKKYLSRAEVADIMGVSPATISRWAREGYLTSGRTVGGHRRYTREHVIQLKNRFFDEYQDQVDTRLQLDKLIEQTQLLPPEHDSVVEIRLHGRAGQGLITTGVLLAEAALNNGEYFQAFPEFGAERSGSPMETFVRISPNPIDIHSPVLRPEIVMVLDPTLLGQVSVFHGTGDEAIAVINFPGSAEDLRDVYEISSRIRLTVVDATRIALEALKRPIPNIPILGALLKVSSIVDPDQMADVITQSLAKRLSPTVVEANRIAFWEGYNQAQVGSD